MLLLDSRIQARLTALVFGLALLSPATAVEPSRRAEHVVLISLDGLRPEFYLDSTWPAPLLQQMASQGVHAKAVRPVFPAVTYPSHSTIVTGALPARHGVYYNQPFEPTGQTGAWYWYEAAIQLPTLWDAIRRAGGTSAAVSWPVTVGAPIDWNLPEVWSLDPAEDPVAAMRQATLPPGLFEEIEREATGKLDASTFGIDFLARDHRTGAAAAYLLERYRPTLLAVHLVEVDHFQHEAGRDGAVIRRALAMADSALSLVVEAAERAGILERTAFLVTGDHGFVDIHTRVAPNVWLADAGLMQTESRPPMWRARFHTTTSTAFLHLRDADDRAAVAEVRELLEALPARKRRLFRVLEREELDRLGSAPEAALALVGAPGVELSSRSHGPDLSPTSGATHGYLTDVAEIYTGLVGWGVGFRPGAVAPVLRLEDVATVVSELLGLAFEAPDGICPQGLLVEIPTVEPE